MTINDAHVHFFSPTFFDLLGAQKNLPPDGRAAAITETLGWQGDASAEALADRWIAELDRQGVARAALIASLPGDEMSVAAAVTKHPSRAVGFFMLDPTRDDAADRAARALDAGLRAICLFPAMHRYSLRDDRVASIFALAAARLRPPAIFVHCGMLSVGVRKKLGLPSPFDISRGNPLDLQGTASRFPQVPVIVPHFGAGLFREALMLADACPQVLLDTSSSNNWIRYVPGLTLTDVFSAAVAVAGAGRLLFGTDSSFFPRGWNKDVLDAQRAAMTAAHLSADEQAAVVGRNFDRLFPL